ncbi:hypothetical protein MBLNU13_g01044t2 [Cladosporium sp. NU13]
MEEEVGGNGRFNEVRSGATPPHLYSLCGMPEEISLRKSVQAFTSRVKQLEQFIISQGLQVPEPDLQHASTIEFLIAAYPSESSNDISPAAEAHSSARREQPQPQFDEASRVQQGQPHASDNHSFFGDVVGNHAFGYTSNNEQVDLPADFDLDWMLGLTDSDNPYGSFDMSTVGSTTCAGLTNHSYGGQSLFGDGMIMENSHHDVPVADDNTSSDEEDHKEVTGQLSDRIGTLLGTSKGNWRFYGATSNLHLSKDRQVLQLEPSTTSQHQARISAQLEFLQLNHTFDAHLTQHLTRLYFTWQNPSLHVVDQDTFEQAQDLRIHKGEKSTFYTEFLVNAMCAVGATFERHTSLDVPKPLPEYFAGRAKAILEIELDEPQVATVQGLVVLSSYEAAATRDTRAWVFSEEGKMTAAEANARNVTMWGSFLNDCGCGLYLGRPSYTNVKDIASDKPYLDNHSSFWTEYVSSDEQAPGLPSFRDPQAMLMDKWIKLYEIMSKLGYSMYVSADASKVELQALGQRTLDRLLEWHSTLPNELVLDIATLETARVLPHVLVLQ